MRIVVLLSVAVLLCVVSSAFAQSESPRATVDRHGIEGEPIEMDTKGPTSVNISTPQGRTVATHIDVLDGSISVVINVDFRNQLLYRGTTPAPIDLGANQGLTITGEVAGAIRPLRTVSPPTK